MITFFLVRDYLESRTKIGLKHIRTKNLNLAQNFFLPVKYCMSYSLTTHKILDCMTRFWHVSCMTSLPVTSYFLSTPISLHQLDTRYPTCFFPTLNPYRFLCGGSSFSLRWLCLLWFMLRQTRHSSRYIPPQDCSSRDFFVQQL